MMFDSNGVGVLLSIQPKWCELIASGRKIIEIRKTKPSLETPFKCYVYCTKSKDMLWVLNESERASNDKIAAIFTAKDVGGAYKANGKIIGEFVCDKIEFLGNISTDPWQCLIGNTHEYHKRLVIEGACLSEKELHDYGGQYSWNISDFVLYDAPLELNRFGVIKAPQSWRFVETLAS